MDQRPEEPTDEYGAYDVVAKPSAKAEGKRLAGLEAKPVELIPEETSTTGAVGKPKVTLGYQSAKSVALEKSDPETLKNLYIPLWLLAGGVTVGVIAAFIREGYDVRAALMRVGMEVVLGTIFLLAGILVAAKVRGINLGNFWIAVFKLAAISVAPSALLAMCMPFLNHIPFGGWIGWIGAFAFYFALLGVLFDLDQSDTWYCVIVIVIVKGVLLFLMAWGIGKWL